jgi:hypothetical protein
LRGGAGAAGRGTKFVSDLDGEGSGGAGLDGEAEFSTGSAGDMSACGTSAAALDRASSGGRGRGSGAETALGGCAACGIGRGGIRLGSVSQPWRCATTIVSDVPVPKEREIWERAICAWPEVAADSRKQTKVTAGQCALTLTISSRPRSTAGGLLQPLQSMNLITYRAGQRRFDVKNWPTSRCSDEARRVPAASAGNGLAEMRR